MKRFIFFTIALIVSTFTFQVSAKLQKVDLTSSVNSDYTQWKQGPEGSATHDCNKSYYYSTERIDGKKLPNVMGSEETIELPVSGLKEGLYLVTLNARITSSYYSTVGFYTKVGEQDRFIEWYNLDNTFKKITLTAFVADGNFIVGIDKNNLNFSFEVQLYSVEAYVDEEVGFSNYIFTDYSSTIPQSHVGWEGSMKDCALGDVITRPNDDVVPIAEYWNWNGANGDGEIEIMSNKLVDDSGYGLFIINLRTQSSTSNKPTDFENEQMDVCYIKIEYGDKTEVRYVPLYVGLTQVEHFATYVFHLITEGGPVKVSLCANQPGTVWHLIQYYQVVSYTTDAYSNIQQIDADINLDDAKFYSLSGSRMDNLQPGINIIRQADGKTKKIFIK